MTYKEARLKAQVISDASKLPFMIIRTLLNVLTGETGFGYMHPETYQKSRFYRELVCVVHPYEEK